MRIGGIRRAERRQSRGHEHARKLPPPNLQRNVVFFCPWRGVQRIEVVTDGAELRKLGRVGRNLGFRSSRYALGRLWAPYMTAALVINVDLDLAVIPQFRPPDPKRYWFKFAYRNRFYPSQVWYAPTRRPGELSAVLTQLGTGGSAASPDRNNPGARSA